MRNSHSGAPATPFCIPGGHIVDPATEWYLLRMSVENGTWFLDTESPARVVCCANHVPETAA
ncbi:MAG TPA: hypothetical protein VGR71_04415 [Nitrospira sp.]|nr:hypothetical protein [Nitrospira sp.]